jgi:hypothetical protein
MICRGLQFPTLASANRQRRSGNLFLVSSHGSGDDFQVQIDSGSQCFVFGFFRPSGKWPAIHYLSISGLSAVGWRETDAGVDASAADARAIDPVQVTGWR